MVHDLNDLNLFVITCFFIVLLLLNLSAYDKLSGFSFCITHILSV